MIDSLVFQAARTPRILWVELTSKCPFDCVFCSRQMRRGAGEHLPLAVYNSLIEALVDPRKLLLNYSGESTVYPDLITAIQRARSTGASVELVSVMATAPESMLGPLSQSGLNRLTVSVHAADDEKFTEIYRHSSFATLRARLERFLELCRAEPRPPAVDLAFVAMDSNLAQLQSVAAFAGGLGLGNIMIFPVIRRDEIPAQFPSELTVLGDHRPEFKQRVRATVDAAAQLHPEIRFTICNESFTSGDCRLGEVPVPYPENLPPGACIHSCEQNPWETAHVLSNGDVVACEVLDKIPLGNLLKQSIDEIWHGAAYQRFRARYQLGEVAECRSCPWKRAYRPGPLSSDIIASRGRSAQLLHGWHEPSDESHIWSSQQSMAVLAPRNGSRSVHISGMLPPGPEDNPNQLTVRLNGAEIGTVNNPWGETIPFGLDFPVTGEQAEPWILEFRTAHVYRPSDRGTGTDQRDLGFALVLMTSRDFIQPEQAKRREQALQPLVCSVQSFDRWALKLAPRWRRAAAQRPDQTLRPGLSIVIPERDNRQELADCLRSVEEAARQWTEPLESIVVVSGSPPSDYRELREAHPWVRWVFHARPLDFARAVRAGLRSARYDWVYLLNNDVILEPLALCSLAPHRASKTFSIASQIVLKDTTRFRDETNWTTLHVEAGLAVIHDRIPTSEASAPNFYAGGGASLFQRRLLKSLLDDSAYAPFYWEDVEWGWRARKLGYESTFCPGSVAHHTKRSSIAHYYSPAEVERIVRRNGFLFQLRNFTSAGSLERVIEAIAQSPEPMASEFLSAGYRWKIARGRLWNHLAPFTDEEVFAQWNSSMSNC